MKNALSRNIDFLADAGSRADFVDTADFMDIIGQVRAEIAHLEAGAAMLAKKLEVEKLCGMRHTGEINGWLATEKGRGPGT